MTVQGPRAAAEPMLPSAVELADRVFRQGSSYSMGEDFPLLFHPSNVENLRVFTDDERVVSLVGMFERDISLLGSRHLSCCIGSVCTDPDYRGQGLATRLLQDARAKALKDGVDIFLISGGRGLYRRQGYVDVGGYRSCTVETDRLPDGNGYTWREWRQQDVPVLSRMHSAEPVRFCRPPDDWTAFLQLEKVANVAGTTYVACPDGQDRPVAYLACQTEPEPDGAGPKRLTVAELGGARAAVLQVLKEATRQNGAAEAEIRYLAGDAEMAELVRRHGWASEPHGFHGTVGIIDPRAFWNGCLPLFAERVGRSRVPNLRDRDGQLRLALDEESVKVGGMRELTELVFLPAERRRELQLELPRGSRLGAAAEQLFPLPLVDYGLNFI